jgi:hypothetical protein
MNLTDIIFFGWYQILDKTIYTYGSRDRVIGPKEHSLFITFLLHGINAWTILSYLAAKYFTANVSLYLSLSVAIVIFLIGYLIYIRRNRAGRVMTNDIKTTKIVLFVIIAIIYTVVSVYCMFETGNYIRYQLTGRY